MNGVVDAFRPVSPEKVLRQIADAVPEACRENMIIIGSLAAGYHYLRGKDMMVRTKDADCLLSPRVMAVQTAEVVTEKLFDDGWRFKKLERWTTPGNADTPDRDLPAVRLRPPGQSDWFLELLTVPESPEDRVQHWSRLKTSHGHFGLCSFGFLSLPSYKPILTDLGIYIARPELMALANLLEHPEIRPETMSGFIQDREIKRSNKDLGRVLAIARLEMGRDEDALLEWPALWQAALETKFPDDWRELASRAGQGLRNLLDSESESDLDEARHTCEWGLLAVNPPTLDSLRIAGQRLIRDAVEPLVDAASQPPAA